MHASAWGSLPASYSNMGGQVVSCIQSNASTGMNHYHFNPARAKVFLVLRKKIGASCTASLLDTPFIAYSLDMRVY